MFLHEKIGELAAYLASGGEGEKALGLIEVLFVSLSDVQAPYDQWRYEEILKTQIPAITKNLGLPVVETFCKLLRQTLQANDEAESGRRLEPSNHWRPAIEEHEQNHTRQTLYEVEHLLVSVLRDAAQQVITQNSSQTKEIIGLLATEKEPIFLRFILHILRLFPDEAPELVIRYITDRSLFDNDELLHEYTLLVQERFSHLPPASQQELLNWIEQGPRDVAAYKSFYEQQWQKQPSDDVVSAYIAHWQRDWLVRLGSQLPSDWQKRFEELVANYGPPEHPEFSSYITVATWVGTKSPKPAQEVAKMPITELISLLREWTPKPSEDWNNPNPSREGLGKEITLAVEQNPQRFAKAARQFQALEPTYVSALLTGLEHVARLKKSFAWLPVLELCDWVIFHPQEGTNGRAANYDPVWAWARNIIARLLLATFESDTPTMPFYMRTKVGSIVLALAEDPDPTPEYEARFGQENMDPTALAINTVRGLAMHTLILYTWWVQRRLEQGKNGSERVARGFQEMPAVRKILEAHLEKDADPSLAIRSVYGQRFPFLALLDPQWATQQASAIFPESEAYRDCWRAAWDAYILFCRPRNTVLDMLQAKYRHAIELTVIAPSAKADPSNPDEHLGMHLISFYLSGKLQLEEPEGLLPYFFLKAPEKLRGQVLTRLGGDLYRNPEMFTPQIIQRMQTLWEHRMQVMMFHQSYPEELQAFGWWFSSPQFDDRWALMQLEQVLEALNKENQKIDAIHWVIERLASVSATMPLPAVTCLTLLLSNGPLQWGTPTEQQQMRSILLHARQSGGEAWQKATEFINRLAARGDLGFRDLLVI